MLSWRRNFLHIFLNWCLEPFLISYVTSCGTCNQANAIKDFPYLSLRMDVIIAFSSFNVAMKSGW